MNEEGEGDEVQMQTGRIEEEEQMKPDGDREHTRENTENQN